MKVHLFLSIKLTADRHVQEDQTLPVQAVHDVEVDAPSELRSEVNQVVNHSAFFLVHIFDVRFKYEADLDLPPAFDGDSDGKFRKELCRVRLAKKFGRVFGFDFTQNAGSGEC